MITIKLSRDQSRILQSAWLPYLVKLCQVKIKDATTDDEIMMAKLSASIVHEVQLMFDKKLDNRGNEFEYKFKDHHAAILYNLLLQLPLDPIQIFILNLRTHITSILHKDLLQLK